MPSRIGCVMPHVFPEENRRRIRANNLEMLPRT
jgi:hypothetical protein